MIIYQNLAELLRTSAKLHPRRTAIVFGQKKINYKNLNDLTDQIACGLFRFRD
jgi:non-ribosomal peptide synthetase component E (peptide arylation enzyme)